MVGLRETEVWEEEREGGGEGGRIMVVDIGGEWTSLASVCRCVGMCISGSARRGCY